MNITLRRSATLLALTIGILQGCGSGSDGGTPPPPPPPLQWGRIYLVQASRQVAESINHRIPDSIVVIARDTAGSQSRPVRDINVRLATGTVAGGGAGAVFHPFGSTIGTQLQNGPTDSTGRFAAAWSMGNVAGAGIVAIRVDTTFVDTIRFTVLPGRAVRVIPRDTAVYQGRTVSIPSIVYDRRNNLTTGAVSYVSRTPGVATVNSSGTASGITLGNSYIILTLPTGAGSMVDSATLAVVPTGTVAVTINDTPSGIVMMNLDGSGYRRLTTSGAGSAAWPSWTANGNEILFGHPHYEDSRIYAVDVDGRQRQVSRANTPNRSELYPRASYDGNWLYFSAGSNWPAYATYRMSSQGTELPVLVGPALTQIDGRLWKGSPSPNGTEFAYRNGAYGLQIVDLASGTARTLSCLTCNQAEHPRYSRDGTWIAFVHERDYGVSLIRPDGTGFRTLVTDSRQGLAAVDWSPDGQWLITRGDGRLQLIRVSDGFVIHLPRSVLSEPSWRPGS